MWIPIMLAAVLALWMPFYITTEYRWDKKRYFFTKMIASLLFISIAVTAFLVLKKPAEYAAWIIAALVLGMIGDLLLVYTDNRKCFLLGLVSFLIGQIVYGVTFLRYIGFSWIDPVLYIVLIAAALFTYTMVDLELGKMNIPVLAYLIIIMFMFVMAVSGLYKSGFNAATTVLISSGAALFLASDVVLAFVIFYKSPPKALRAVNLSLYYAAQMLLALTVVTV